MAPSYYAVAKGRTTGIFGSWDSCKKQTNKFPSAKFKGFPSLNEAENFLRENGVSEIKNYISRSPPRNFFSPKSPKSSKQQIQSKKNVGQSIKSDVSQPSANLDNLWNTTENSVLLDETPCLQADPDSQYTLKFDGGSRGNPGPAGAGASLSSESGNEEIGAISKFVGKQTNNFAEYTALILGLAAALRIGVRRLKAYGDSKLVAQQVQGKWKVSNSGLQPLHRKAIALKSKFDSFSIQHIYRDNNKRADALANLAMDGKDWSGLETSKGYVHFSIDRLLQSESNHQSKSKLKDLIHNSKREREEESLDIKDQKKAKQN